MGIDAEKEIDPVEIAVKLLKEGKIRNGVQLEGYALGNGMTSPQLQRKNKNNIKETGRRSQDLIILLGRKNPKGNRRDQYSYSVNRIVSSVRTIHSFKCSHNP